MGTAYLDKKKLFGHFQITVISIIMAEGKIGRHFSSICQQVALTDTASTLVEH